MDAIETTLLLRLSNLPVQEAMKAFDQWSKKANESDLARLAYMKTIVTHHSKRYVDMAQSIIEENEPQLEGTTDEEVRTLREHYEKKGKILQVMLNAITKAKLENLDEQTIQQTKIQRQSRNEQVANAITQLANTGQTGVDMAIQGMSGLAKIIIAYQTNKEKIKKGYIDGAIDSLEQSNQRLQQIQTSYTAKYGVRSNQVLQLRQIEQERIANEKRQITNDNLEKIQQNLGAEGREGREPELNINSLEHRIKLLSDRMEEFEREIERFKSLEEARGGETRNEVQGLTPQASVESLPQNVVEDPTLPNMADTIKVNEQEKEGSKRTEKKGVNQRLEEKGTQTETRVEQGTQTGIEDLTLSAGEQDKKQGTGEIQQLNGRSFLLSTTNTSETRTKAGSTTTSRGHSQPKQSGKMKPKRKPKPKPAWR